jgi:hypothetical protein
VATAYVFGVHAVEDFLDRPRTALLSDERG